VITVLEKRGFEDLEKLVEDFFCSSIRVGSRGRERGNPKVLWE
jgi:hypothetical protein